MMGSQLLRVLLLLVPDNESDVNMSNLRIARIAA